MFEFKTKHIASIMVGLFILVASAVFFFNQWYFNPVAVIALFIAALPFILDFMNETKRQKELELKFLEFVRSLVESVRSGIAIPQAITHTAKVDYGALTPYIKQLANQIELGFPLHQAFKNFAKHTKNEVIDRSVSIVIQSEKSGGDMASVLEAVTRSVYEIKKVKEEQKSNAYGQIIQGYIIFFVFIVIMVVLQVYLLPKLSEIGSELSGGLAGGMSFAGSSAAVATSGGMDLGSILIATIIIQGFFAGLMLGKFSEDDFKAGVKHSLIMCIMGYLVIATATGIFGTGTEEVIATAAQSLVFVFPYRWLRCKIKKV